MIEIFFHRYDINIIILLFIKFSFNSSTIIYEITQAVFLNPQTNTALIKCPLNLTNNLDIQWYDIINHRYELDHGQYYRIYGLQKIDRQLICSSISQNNEKYKFKIQTYDRPLPIQYVSIPEITNTSLTLLWKDNNYNQNANITYYELILKYNNTIQYRILVNNILSTYTFSSLHPNTDYSIDLSVIDIWKRYSKSITINGKTLLSNKKIFFHKIIDHYLLDQSISCYYLNYQLLLIEFNHSKLQKLNYIYNLTIYNNKNEIILIDNLYSYEQKLPLIKTFYSFIYYLKENYFKYHIKLILSTIQLEYLGKICKYCENFYPIYSPLICSIKLINLNKYYLIIHMQLFNSNKYIRTFKPNYIFYQINQTYFIKKRIYDIHKYIIVNIIDVKENYSVIVENELIGSDTNEKLNISILCSINRIASINQNNRISDGFIIGLVLLITSFTILVFFIVYQKGLISNCRHYVYSFRKNDHPRSCLIQIGENYNKFDSISIPIDQFPLYVLNMHKDNDLGFIQLFENICESSRTYKYSVDISQIEYNNILSYDHSCEKENYIDGYEKTNAYIAIQGPMMNTINDFWKMIWEKDVYVLVMITNINECGKIKYDVYWPEDGTEIYGIIEVTLINTISLAYYVKRIFAIRCITNQKFTDYKRLVHQFHYTNWPDHGVPLFTLPVLTFIRHSSACNPENGGPIVVHCSSDVSHTGTYIVIDTMLKKINNSQSLNIPYFLKYIQQQQNYLVQTEKQFIFIYDVLFEAVQQLLNIGYNNLELNKKNFNNIIKMLDYYDKDSNIKQIEKQFQLIITKIKRNDYQLLIKQNSKQSINPYRVLLSIDREYINASYIHGYYRIDEFIITQHPIMNTKIDFWQIIWNNNVNIIVSLYADEKLEFDIPDIWPLLNQIMNCGNFNVYLIDENFECEYIYRDFLLRSTKDNSELRVKVISNSYWPDTCSPIKTSFNLINIIRNFNSNRPIVVHDLLGGHRAATFCALYTMNEQIKIEGLLNVYELAKLYHIKRPGIWRDNSDLLFLYRCAEILFREYKSSNYNHHYSL